MADQYKGFDAASLPKRRTNRIDMDAARALLAVVQEHGSASNFKSYETASKARNGALVAARLLERVAEGQTPTIRTFPVDAKGKPTSSDEPAGFAWMVSFKSEPVAQADETTAE